MAGERGRRLHAALGTVRVRTTAASVLVVGVALVVGSIVLLSVLRRELVDNVRTAASFRAEDVAESLERGTPPSDLALEAEDDLFVQVVNERGRVVAASTNLDGEPPVASVPEGSSKRVHGVAGNPDDFVVVSEVADTGPGHPVVLVGRSLDSVGQSVSLVQRGLLVGVPLVLLVVALTAWLLTGRALAPVEAIRSEVAEISAAEIHRRVPDPVGDDEIARLARTMNAMLQRLDDAQARQRRFVSDASHELRSPVAAIRNHAEVARAHPQRTTVGELATVVLSEDDRLERLVDDLLWLARSDEQLLTGHRRPVDLDDLVLEEARRLRAEGSLRVDTNDVSAGQVVGDRSQLRRMLRNLVDNAARHAKARVALALSETDGEVTLDVDDDGAGIPEGERSRVFERFVRLDDARARDDGGSGLGLAIVAEIAEAHDGRVRVDDAPIGGARLEVRLPAAPG